MHETKVKDLPRELFTVDGNTLMARRNSPSLLVLSQKSRQKLRLVGGRSSFPKNFG